MPGFADTALYPEFVEAVRDARSTADVVGETFQRVSYLRVN